MDPLNTSGMIGRIVTEEDGSSTGAYGPFKLQTALQPIFAPGGADGVRLPGFEALLRLSRGNEAFSTTDFLSRIGSKERLALDEFCRSLHLMNASLEKSGHLLLFLNVNPALYDGSRVVAAQVSNLMRQVEKSQYSPRQIVCEITEHRTPSPGLLSLLVETLRERGFKIAVDDFGIDGSDSKRVALIQPDIVKFDADWVTRLMGSKAGFSSLKDTVSQFHQLGVQVVMEGLESSWQVDLGWGAGADLIQGYGLAHPQIAPTDFGNLYNIGRKAG
ncbi:MAG: EAL domain-containing protein [Alphaproteobacteria bacterium]|nr:EAL domain-containing protein [Alphaproteobacteria bacterium]